MKFNFPRPHESESMFRSLFGDSRVDLLCWSQKKEVNQKVSNLPGISTNYMEIVITHVSKKKVI